jgi:PAS domain S-box-containing protein
MNTPEAREARELTKGFRAVLDNMSEGVMLFDRQQNLFYQNPASLRIHGFAGVEEGRIEHDNLPATWNAWDENGRPLSFEEWPVSRVFRGERFQNQVLRAVRVETGQEFVASYNGSPIFDAEGKLTLGFITIREITKEFMAREAARASERRMRTFFESEMVGALHWNMDGKITGANDKFLRMVGYSREEVLSGKVSWAEMTPPEYRPLDERAVEELRTKGADTAYEKEFIRKDGTRVPIIIGAAMLNEGRQDGVAFVLDITERKRAEQDRERLLREVEESRNRFQAVVEHTPVGICVWRGPDLVHELANPAFQKFAPEKQIVGKRYSEVWPEIGERYAAIIRRVMDTGEPYSVVDDLVPIRRSPDGPLQEAYFNVSCYRLGPDGSGQPGVLGVVTETTHRVRRIVALRESEQRYRTLFESIDEGFCTIEVLFDEKQKPVDYRFLAINPAFERQTGIQNAVGRRIREIAPLHEEKWFQIYGQVALTGEPVRFENPATQLNRYFDVYAFRIGPALERKVAVLFNDISERKKAEEVLARDKAELERLVAERTARLQELVGELEHFSYTITHDLKAPLRAMHGFAEVAAEMCAQSEARPFLEKISTAAERMDALIRDALNYSQTVRQELPLEDVDTWALLRGMLDSYPQFQPWKASIRLEGPLPAVLGNAAGLTQCFSNLLGNAVKFVRPGQLPEIRIRAEQRDGWSRIWIEDNGIGIPAQMQPRVFDMFARASKDYEGTGIGLALVRKAVQRMGGRVGLESEPGKWSRFWIELKSGAVHLQLDSAAGGAAPKGTVLYVEDEESDSALMQRVFAKRGVEAALRVVRDGRAAIEFLSGAGKYGDRTEYPLPALVLLDLNLPVVSGFEVLQWMRNHPEFARTPVVIFSSSTLEDDRAKAQALGANAFLTKPSSGLELGRIVDDLRQNWLG